MQINSMPSVTIAIPTYNEALYIHRVITNFLQTTYPNVLEILVIDGGSTDNTQAIVQKLSQNDPRVRLLQNPHKIQSAAMNIALAEAQGDVLLRADAHSDYASDYIERCIETLLETNALNVGGAQRFVAATAFQAGIALASRSFFGNGGAKYRNPDYNGYADTVYMGCFKKSAFELLNRSHLKPTHYKDTDGKDQEVTSFFDLEQVVNEDAELNLCLQELQTNAIYISSKIKVWYYPRKTWQALARQFFLYGKGRCRTTQNHKHQAPLRGRVPFISLILVIVIFLTDKLLCRGRLHSTKIFLLGLSVPLLEAIRMTWITRNSFITEIWRGDTKNPPTLFERWLFCSVALFTKPIAYVIGFTYQLCRMKILKRYDW